MSSTDNISKEMAEVINKNLPAAVATELNKYLTEADKNSRLVISQQNTINEYVRDINVLRNSITELQLIVNTGGAITKREKLVAALEDKLELTISRLKTDEAEKRADGIYKLVETIFRNPVYVKEVSRSTSGTGTKSSYPGGADSHCGNDSEVVKCRVD